MREIEYRHRAGNNDKPTWASRESRYRNYASCEVDSQSRAVSAFKPWRESWSATALYRGDSFHRSRHEYVATMLSPYVSPAEIQERLRDAVQYILPRSWLPREETTSHTRPVARNDGPGSSLDQAYDNLHKLLLRQHVEGTSPALEQETEAAWAHLDELQEASGADVLAMLDASVPLPPDELEELLRRARRELADEEP